MASITTAAGQVRDQAHGWISDAMGRDVCAAIGHTWRDRLLTPTVTLRLFVWQVLWGNVACRAVTHLSALTFTAGPAARRGRVCPWTCSVASRRR